MPPTWLRLAFASNESDDQETGHKQHCSILIFGKEYPHSALQAKQSPAVLTDFTSATITTNNLVSFEHVAQASAAMDPSQDYDHKYALSRRADQVYPTCGTLIVRLH